MTMMKEKGLSDMCGLSQDPLTMIRKTMLKKKNNNNVKKKKNLQICADPLSSALRILRELTAATVDDCLGGEKGGEGGRFGPRNYLDIYICEM